MPYEFLPAAPPDTHLRLWPHRSLSPRGFVWFIGTTAALIAVPLIGLLGTPALWALLPFLVIAIVGIWLALSRSYKDARIVEDLRLTPDTISLTRQDPVQRHDWQANPHWVRLTLHETGGPVPNYLTLSGNNREVELGAFLSEAERIELSRELRQRLAALKP